ncbi:hypothetical protein BLAT2472_20414 [Burkholderia latens]
MSAGAAQHGTSASGMRPEQPDDCDNRRSDSPRRHGSFHIARLLTGAGVIAPTDQSEIPVICDIAPTAAPLGAEQRTGHGCGSHAVDYGDVASVPWHQYWMHMECAASTLTRDRSMFDRARGVRQQHRSSDQNAALPTDAPPSTNKVCPVIKPASCDKRNAAAAVNSSGSPNRFIGTREESAVPLRCRPACPAGTTRSR